MSVTHTEHQLLQDQAVWLEEKKKTKEKKKPLLRTWLVDKNADAVVKTKASEIMLAVDVVHRRILCGHRRNCLCRLLSPKCFPITGLTLAFLRDLQSASGSVFDTFLIEDVLLLIGLPLCCGSKWPNLFVLFDFFFLSVTFV